MDTPLSSNYAEVDEELNSHTGCSLPPLVCMSEPSSNYGRPLDGLTTCSTGPHLHLSSTQTAPLQSLTIEEYHPPQLPTASPSVQRIEVGSAGPRAQRQALSVSDPHSSSPSSHGALSGKGSSDRMPLPQFQPSRSSAEGSVRQSLSGPLMSTVMDVSLARGLGLSGAVIDCDVSSSSEFGTRSGSAALLRGMALPSDRSRSSPRLRGEECGGGCLHGDGFTVQKNIPTTLMDVSSMDMPASKYPGRSDHFEPTSMADDFRL